MISELERQTGSRQGTRGMAEGSGGNPVPIMLSLLQSWSL